MTGRDECRLRGCKREPGAEDSELTYRDGTFCSPQHDVKYEHLKDDARDAERAAEERGV